MLNKSTPRIVSIVATLIVAVHMCWFECSANGATPVNSKASQQAKNLLNFFADNSGLFILSGEHNYAANPTQYFDLAYSLTGKYPGLWGCDFGFAGSSSKDTVYNRAGLVAEAENVWSNGSVVTLCWHMAPPLVSEPTDFTNITNPLTTQQWSDIVTPGTSLYSEFTNRIDEIVPYLKQLRDAGVPVLWRPFHEINAGGFWWSDPSDPTKSQKLYQIMYNEYVNNQGLSNLLWNWNTDECWRDGSHNPASFYPGSNYVDIATMDIYNNDFTNPAINSLNYNTMVSIAAGKPIGIGECGPLPTASFLATNEPLWTYFMCWCEYLTNANTQSSVITLYNDASTLNQNLLKNSGFENGSTNWILGSAFSVTSANVFAGTNSLRLNGQGTWDSVEQTVNVSPNTSYKFQFWGKCNAVEDFKVLSGSTVITSQHTLADNVWDPYTVTFNTGSYTSVTVYIGDGVLGVTCYFDNLSVN